MPFALRVRRILSRISLVLALVTVAGVFFLICPDPTATYPGAIPWSRFSVLKLIIDGMSLSHLVATERGSEIKEFVFHLATVAALLVLSARAVVSHRWPVRSQGGRGAWFFAQILLAGWVAMSFASQIWSGDAPLARGQAVLYALEVGWAIALAWTLERRDIPWLLAGLSVLSVLASVLCIWHFHERNPFHRPGFPLGNPGVLAAAIIPAILICVSVLGRAVERWLVLRRDSGADDEPSLGPLACWAIPAGIALIPLGYCFYLTNARAAMIGLAVGLLVVALLRSPPRVRWIIAGGAAVLIAAGGLWVYSGRMNDTMARGPTIRFRLYMWQYAAEIWGRRAISGAGAGAFARLGGVYGIEDRRLDAAAFMGDWPGHAHNELFEILAEIGLLGGVTFVGGFVASAAAAWWLLRSRKPGLSDWLLTGAFGGLAALLADSMFSVGLRLPGVPAVFFTLLGTLWAASRCVTDTPASDAPASDAAAQFGQKKVIRRWTVAALATTAAAGAGWAAVRNWSGVLHEQSARTHYFEGRPAQAARHASLAEQRLLDPLRRLYAHERIVRCQYELARRAFAADPDQEEEVAEAAGLCRAAYRAALLLDQRAPTLMSMPIVAARCAEMLVRLYASGNAQKIVEWHNRAARAWWLQKSRRPWDAEALEALTRYRLPLSERIALLRDALRAGIPGSGWMEALRRTAGEPAFEETLARFQLEAGPMDPKTNLDLLVNSAAPELYRLLGIYARQHEAYRDAADYAARAAELYEPLRHRFPNLKSIALSEQAEYTFIASPTDPAEAARLVQAAIAALPAIQTQQYDLMAAPFRRQYALYALAGGDEQAAEPVLRQLLGADADLALAMADEYVRLSKMFIRRTADQRPPLRPWLRAALRHVPAHTLAWSWIAWLAAADGQLDVLEAVLGDAAAAGVTAGDIGLIRRSLAQEYPELRERLIPQSSP